MIGLRLEITRFVEEGQPNLVECIFIDSHGKKHSIIEKVPVVSSEELKADSSYPRSGVIACQVIQRKKHGDSEIVEIDTAIPWHIESIAGQNFFDVLPGQLIEF
jgi:hypothetical protein